MPSDHKKCIHTTHGLDVSVVLVGMVVVRHFRFDWPMKVSYVILAHIYDEILLQSQS